MTMNFIDEEVLSLAEHALAEKYYTDFCDLVNRYIAAAEGLDVQRVAELMADRTSLYDRIRDAEVDMLVNIWTKDLDGFTTGHETLLEALQFQDATEVHMEGNKVFEKRPDIGWYFVG